MSGEPFRTPTTYGVKRRHDDDDAGGGGGGGSGSGSGGSGDSGGDSGVRGAAKKRLRLEEGKPLLVNAASSPARAVAIYLTGGAAVAAIFAADAKAVADATTAAHGGAAAYAVAKARAASASATAVAVGALAAIARDVAEDGGEVASADCVPITWVAAAAAGRIAAPRANVPSVERAAFAAGTTPASSRFVVPAAAAADSVGPSIALLPEVPAVAEPLVRAGVWPDTLLPPMRAAAVPASAAALPDRSAAPNLMPVASDHELIAAALVMDTEQPRAAGDGSTAVVAPSPSEAAPRVATAVVAPSPSEAAPRVATAVVAPSPSEAAPRVATAVVAPRPSEAAPRVASAVVAPSPSEAAPRAATVVVGAPSVSEAAPRVAGGSAVSRDGDGARGGVVGGCHENSLHVSSGCGGGGGGGNETRYAERHHMGCLGTPTTCMCMKRTGGCYLSTGAPSSQPRWGRWALLVPAEVADAVWERTRVLVRDGHLGPRASAPNGPLSVAICGAIPYYARRDGDREINVFTRDSGDQADIWRVFLTLARDPVIGPLLARGRGRGRVNYRSEAEARAGVYSTEEMAALFGRKLRQLSPSAKRTTLYAEQLDNGKWALLKNNCTNMRGDVEHGVPQLRE